MQVQLAGYNVDAEILKQLKEKAAWDQDNVTPETLSAAYARISRDPRNIDEIRADARVNVDKSRKSNETIIFGYGHGSVAEHAVFNFDIVDLSRYAVEYVQQHRLASYTEKSQRYLKLADSFYTPDNLDATLHKQYTSVVKACFSLYNDLYEELTLRFRAKGLDDKTAENKAKEDARYILPLCTYSQFGMTVNARELELMIRDFNSTSITELHTLAANLLKQAGDIAPSLIKYTSPTLYSRNSANTQVLVDGFLTPFTDSKDRGLIKDSIDRDTLLCTAILYYHSNQSYTTCYFAAYKMTSLERKLLIKSVLENKKSFESVGRYFEFIDFTFSLEVSSSCYAQLKRHRLTSQLVQDYSLANGYTIPSSFSMLPQHLTTRYKSQLRELEDLSEMLVSGDRNYVISAAHKRRVLLKFNARELYQFIYLRASEEAQWDIRNVAQEIIEQTEKNAPLVCMLLSGKDKYDEKYKEVFTS